MSKLKNQNNQTLTDLLNKYNRLITLFEDLETDNCKETIRILLKNTHEKISKKIKEESQD